MIRTNHKPRPVVYGFELTETERKEFDYLESIDDSQFIRFKGMVYDIGEFSRIIPPGAPRKQPTECQTIELQGWDGYLSDSFFSATLVKFVDDGESVIVGTYIC